jgi:xylan 1,4-beta-xylosidase
MYRRNPEFPKELCRRPFWRFADGTLQRVICFTYAGTPPGMKHMSRSNRLLPHTSRREFLNAGSSAIVGAMLPRGPETQVIRTDDSGQVMSPPGRDLYPYSGVSGPGFPVDSASAHGGWRSGSEGLAYEGEHPPKFPTQPWNNAATGSAVKIGLLPPILPLVEAQVRDTIVCRAGDGNYYMTGSTGQNIWAFNDGVELWKSSDLKQWEYLGLVWSVEKDGTWERPWRSLHGKPSRAVWAPELHYVRGTYVICLSMAPSGIAILKSTSGKPTGPYIHAFSAEKSIANGIDPTIFEDDDGKVYFTYGSATRIARLKDDLSGFEEQFRPVILSDPDHTPDHHASKCVGRGSNDLGTEGAELFKANGVYYLGAADTYDGRYSTCVAMSENVYGPYHSRHESVPCAGGTGFFQDHGGGWWTSFFGNDSQAPFREKPAIVKIDFASDGKIIVAKDQPLIKGWNQST